MFHAFWVPGEKNVKTEVRMSALIVILGITFLSQYPQEQHEVAVRNVVVHLRVYDGSTFIENLTIDDLELLENGKPQKIQALYLTLNKQIERFEAERDYVPYIGRSYYFLFQITEFNPRIGDALEYFFTKVFHPDDSVLVMTPYKNYTLKRVCGGEFDGSLISDNSFSGSTTIIIPAFFSIWLDYPGLGGPDGNRSASEEINGANKQREDLSDISCKSRDG